MTLFDCKNPRYPRLVCPECADLARKRPRQKPAMTSEYCDLCCEWKPVAGSHEYGHFDAADLVVIHIKLKGINLTQSVSVQGTSGGEA